MNIESDNTICTPPEIVEAAMILIFAVEIYTYYKQIKYPLIFVTNEN